MLKIPGNITATLPLCTRPVSLTNPKIMSLGEVLWDLFPDGEQFGGAPANVACHAAILDGDVSMISAVGDDLHGRSAISILEDYGIDAGLMQVISDAATGTVGVALDADGKPTFTIHEGSAWDQLAWNEKLGSRIAEVDAVYFGTLGQRSEVSRSTIRQALRVASNVPRILDINLRPPFFDATLIRESVELASILKLSDEELATVCNACGVESSGSSEVQPGQLLMLLRKQSLDLVIMTRGADGAMLATPDGIVEQPGIPTTVADTVGAGDSFTAAFLLGLLRGESHEDNLRNACAVAAGVCAHAGAVPNRGSDR
jgi:fructokinase